LLDVSPWLEPVDGENPSGVSLRDHPSFHEIERLMEPRVEVMRDERNRPVSEVPIPVDWSEVLAKSEELRRHGRDLRLLVIVARAHANERGLAGLADGLTLIARTLEAHWETLHPELRSGGTPREAALRRTNALGGLQITRDGLLGDMRARVFFDLRGLGPVTGLDLERGMLDARTALADLEGISEATRAEETARHEALIARVRGALAALADKAGDERTALTESARAAVAAAEAVEAALAARLGDGTYLPDLKRFLSRVLATVDRPAPAPAAAVEAPASGGAVTTPAPAAPAVGGVPGAITSRQEVVACLDRIIEFYDRTEPASPVPFLARRMRRMVPMDFLELMEDLAPSGLKEFRSLAGIADKSSSRTQGEKS
jgi:type VI secretion system protein ImpA